MAPASAVGEALAASAVGEALVASDVALSLFVVLVASVVALAVGDGNNSRIDLLIKGLHYTGGAVASYTPYMEYMRPPVL